MPKILLATGQKEIDEAVIHLGTYEIANVLEKKDEVMEACEFYQPDILLVGEALPGLQSTISLLMNLVKAFPQVRIVYLAGYVDLKDEQKVNTLGLLVMAGIYDIIHEKTIKLQMLTHLLDHPRTYESVAYLTKRLKDTTHRSVQDTITKLDIPKEENKENEETYANVYVISSIKPGTGKSFLSTNLAAAIAKFGESPEGKSPKVALIEADLQNLSVGTLLAIEDDKKNLKTVMNQIATIINDQGKLIGTTGEIEKVNDYIRSCFKPYLYANNLEALVGSQLTFSEIENIKAEYYAYLLDVASKYYDVVIVDTNSSLSHITTYTLLCLARSCYYILNLDFNNIRNNVRYKEVLKEMGIYDKVHYVLNEDVSEETGSNQKEDLIFSANQLNDKDFKLEARIPELPKSVFLNRLYNGIPVVLDNNHYTLKARYEIMKIANQIYPIKNLAKMEAEMEKEKNGKKKHLFF